jgi:hypothetical protein
MLRESLVDMSFWEAVFCTGMFLALSIRISYLEEGFKRHCRSSK